MIPTAYAVPQENTSPRFANAWAQGCGGKVESSGQLQPGPVALFGSPARWGLLHQAIAEGRDWYYADHGYFGRYKYYRITRNGFQHDGTRCCGAPPDELRLEKLGIEIKPWRRKGDYILICPPDEAFARLIGFDAGNWTLHITAALARLSTRPVRIRERCCAAQSSLAAELDGAWCLVTYVSNAAVESICSGVPAICTGKCASSVLSSPDLAVIDDPPRPPGRRAWAATLAANQWTMAEIAAGTAWRALGKTA